MKKQRLFLFLGILISFLFVTGCAASTELIADGANVTMLIDLDDIAVPKKAVKYTSSLEFPVNDVQVLGDVFSGMRPMSFPTTLWATPFGMGIKL